MSKVKILDCTLRDGGYANNWDFTSKQISTTVLNLTNAGIDYIELGFLTSWNNLVNGSQFSDVEAASSFLPKDRKRSKYLLMADVAQFDADTLCPRSEKTVDGIRIVFYKRQAQQAIPFCSKIVEMGYDLFLQPMVTVDYSSLEFEKLVERFCKDYRPYAISVVDSFGSMTRSDLSAFIKILDEKIDKNIKIGFHGHDNMQLLLSNTLSLLEYESDREILIDTSVSGMGRGAGNLCTELFANYMNCECETDYNLDDIFSVISDVTQPISRTVKWGTSPYLMLTALRRAHPNFATYLLANHDVSVNEFRAYLRTIPDDMLTKCTRPYVEETYEKFLRKKQGE